MATQNTRDTRPKSFFERIINGATNLLHEATSTPVVPPPAAPGAQQNGANTIIAGGVKVNARTNQANGATQPVVNKPATVVAPTVVQKPAPVIAPEIPAVAAQVVSAENAPVSPVIPTEISPPPERAELSSVAPVIIADVAQVQVTAPADQPVQPVAPVAELANKIEIMSAEVLAVAKQELNTLSFTPENVAVMAPHLSAVQNAEVTTQINALVAELAKEGLQLGAGAGDAAHLKTLQAIKKEMETPEGRKRMMAQYADHKGEKDPIASINAEQKKKEEEEKKEKRAEAEFRKSEEAHIVTKFVASMVSHASASVAGVAVAGVAGVAKIFIPPAKAQNINRTSHQTIAPAPATITQAKDVGGGGKPNLMQSAVNSGQALARKSLKLAEDIGSSIVSGGEQIYDQVVYAVRNPGETASKGLRLVENIGSSVVRGSNKLLDKTAELVAQAGSAVVSGAKGAGRAVANTVMGLFGSKQTTTVPLQANTTQVVLRPGQSTSGQSASRPTAQQIAESAAKAVAPQNPVQAKPTPQQTNYKPAPLPISVKKKNMPSIPSPFLIPSAPTFNTEQSGDRG